MMKMMKMTKMMKYPDPLFTVAEAFMDVPVSSVRI